MAQHEEAYVKYSSAFPFSAIRHPNGDSFKLMLYIRTRLSSTLQEHVFLRPFFIRVILLKMIKTIYIRKIKKMRTQNTLSNAKTLKSFETNTNVLKPSVSLPRLL